MNGLMKPRKDEGSSENIEPRNPEPWTEFSSSLKLQLALVHCNLINSKRRVTKIKGKSNFPLNKERRHDISLAQYN